MLAGLQVLHLGYNDINNTLDEGWGTGTSWAQMQRLSLQDNYFYGTLPSAWALTGHWSQLTLLNISNNHLQGGVPGRAMTMPPMTFALRAALQSIPTSEAGSSGTNVRHLCDQKGKEEATIRILQSLC